LLRAPALTEMLLTAACLRCQVVSDRLQKALALTLDVHADAENDHRVKKDERTEHQLAALGGQASENDLAVRNLVRQEASLMSRVGDRGKGRTPSYARCNARSKLRGRAGGSHRRPRGPRLRAGGALMVEPAGRVRCAGSFASNEALRLASLIISIISGYGEAHVACASSRVDFDLPIAAIS
jgi:hypothetical protein